MSKEERLQKILRYLDGSGSVTVKELSGSLYVSLPTVYRDLRELQRRNLVSHTDGCVQRIQEQAVNTPLNHRLTAHAAEKSAIAATAVQLLHDDMTLFLDASSTVSFLIEHLKQFSGLTVLTNGLTTALLLRQAGIETVCVGGALAENSLAAAGRIAYDTIARYPIDGHFFSAYAVDERGRITDPSEHESFLRRMVAQQAAFSALLCDHSKFDKSSLFYIADLGDIDYLVTDALRPGMELAVKRSVLLAR